MFDESVFTGARLFIFGVLALVLVAFGAWLAHLYYAPELADAQDKVSIMTTINSSLRNSIASQNKAIAQLKADEEQRRIENLEAMKKIRQIYSTNQNKAQALLLVKPPAGQDLCVSAAAAFDAQLKDERGVK